MYHERVLLLRQMFSSVGSFCVWSKSGNAVNNSLIFRRSRFALVFEQSEHRGLDRRKSSGV
jgi:hypothetical protein